MAEKPLTEWSSNLFDCFEDASTCCYGFWCGPCLACTVSGRFKEYFCLPLCDILTPVARPAALSLRAAMRNRYGIKGSLINDMVASCFCTWCTYCQMHRELKHRNKTPAVVNVQNNTPVNMQPAPMMMMMMPVNPSPAGFPSQSGVVMMS